MALGWIAEHCCRTLCEHCVDHPNQPYYFHFQLPFHVLLFTLYLVKDTHIVALTMIPCIFIKIATSTSMAVLTTSSADLVSPDKKKILMFSCAIWARGWFLWAPFIGATSFYGVLVPLTIFAAMSVIGGLLNICIYQGQCEQERTAVDMTKAIKDKGKINI